MTWTAGDTTDAMPVLHLVCGLPGSGKSTLAKRLELEGPSLRLSPDEWMARILGDLHCERRRATIEALQWEIARKALCLGIDVILENGFWSFAEREAYRAKAAAIGARTTLHYLDVPRDELWRRLELRNSEVPDGFRVSEEELDRWWGWFEPPTAEELE